MADSGPAERKGLFESMTNLTGTLIGVVQTRLSLLATDVELGNQRLLSMLGLALTAAFSVGVGVVLAIVAIVLAFWHTHRILVLGALAVLFLLVGLGAWRLAVHRLRTQPKPFAASLLELSKDRAFFTRR
jgi:uncharacterized membrane protein YqjE